jgi:hypothetical protein
VGLRPGQPDPSRCDICRHSLDRHNSLGYCRAESKRGGQCVCDGTSSMAAIVETQRAR